jgi:hypothetical protein
LEWSEFAEGASIAAPGLIAVLMGAAMVKQRRRRYWLWAGGLTLVVSVAFLASVPRQDVPHALVANIISMGIFITVPMMTSFGIQRLTATAPRWIAVGIGIVAYIPIVLATLTLTMNLGEIFAPVLPHVPFP